MTVYLGKDRQRTAQHLTATHATVSEVTKDMATNCIWTISSPPPTYSMIWPRKKFTVVALSDPTGRALAP